MRGRQGFLWKTARRSEPEARLVSAIRDWVALHRNLVDLDRVHSGKVAIGRFIPKAAGGGFVPAGFMECARAGTPDFLGMVKAGQARLRIGKAVLVECKRDGEDPTEEQLERLCAARAADAVAILAYDVEQFEEELLEAIGLARDRDGRIRPAEPRSEQLPG